MKEVECSNCGKLFVKRFTPGKHKRHYCTVECRRADKNSCIAEWSDERRREYSEKFKGENNPNFGKRWTAEQKQAASVLKQQQYDADPGYRYKVGASNRGVKFSEDRIRKMHENRTPESYIRSHSDDIKKIIGQKSKEKWTDEYKEKHRKAMEDLGFWIPKSQVHPYKMYYKESNWIRNMIEYFDDQSLRNLHHFGIFSKTNTRGFVRDHIVPRKVGYEFALPPYILRHPANLQFISHAENVQKGFLDRKLTLQEQQCIIDLLLERILAFDKCWEEHDTCINFIKERRAV
jgi:L-rhamnose mutarotase